MKVEYFVKREYISISPLSGVAEIRNQLLQYSAMVIMEDNQYFGVLTAVDLLKKPHILVLDCICYKTAFEINESISNALFYMKRDNTDVLPVFDNKKFIGLVYKDDINEYLHEHNQELQQEIEQHIKNLEEKKTEFKNIIQQRNEELEKIIEQRTKELIDLVETKEKFISIIVHELRNPFNGILGFLSLLQKNLREYDINTIENYLTQVYRSAKMTFDLLVNLSEWLNAKNKKIPYIPENISIHQLLTEEIFTTSLSAEQKQITINNHVPENIYLHVDKNMVKTIFRNLLQNSIKFTNPNGQITVYANENEEYIEITVKDTGIGLTRELIDKIFKSEKVNSLLGTANETGTGLGLLLCKEFVELEGGKIWVESILGEGSEFKFTLPRINQQYIDHEKNKNT